MKRKGLRFPNGIPRAGSLRDRIAAVCSAEVRRQQYDRCPCTVAPVFNMDAMADAIIKHLQLTEDSGVIVGCTHDE